MKIIYTHTDEAPAWPRSRSCRSSRRSPGSPGSRWRSVTSRWPDGSWPSSPTVCPPTSRSRTPWPSWASWPRPPRPTSSSCPTSAPRCPSSRPPIAELQAARLRRSRTIPTTRPTTRSARSAPATTGSRAAPSTRCCARATRIAGRRPRSSTTPAPIPHPMGAWSPRVADPTWLDMTDGDFRSTERSVTVERDGGALRIEHVAADGTVTVLKDSTSRCSPARWSTPRSCAVAALRRVPDRADRRGQGAGRPVLGASEGHDDEGLGPDHLRPCGAGLLPGLFAEHGGRAGARPASAPTTGSGAHPRRRSRRCPTASGGHHARPSMPS